MNKRAGVMLEMRTNVEIAGRRFARGSRAEIAHRHAEVLIARGAAVRIEQSNPSPRKSNKRNRGRGAEGAAGIGSPAAPEAQNSSAAGAAMPPNMED